MRQAIKVMIVDDHTIVREGLKQLLSGEEEIQVVAEANDGEEAIKLAKKSHADVIVLDISMPKTGGLEVIKPLMQEVPNAKIVILSMYGREAFAKEALRAGAFAYILKGDSSEELVTAIHTVFKGDYYFSGKLRSSMVTSFIGETSSKPSKGIDRYQSLSEREKQFFHHMLKGRSTKEISKILGISDKTGQKHHTSVLKKLEVQSPLELFKYGIQIGLLDPESLADS